MQFQCKTLTFTISLISSNPKLPPLPSSITLKSWNPPLFRSNSQRPSRRSESFLRSSVARRSKKQTSSIPKGHVLVYKGDEMERFVVSAELLNHPVFIGLLNRSAQEYGYEQKGVIQIPCHVLFFERIMESLRLGLPVPIDVQDLIGGETI